MASNMLAAYEASESIDDFGRITRDNLGIAIEPKTTAAPVTVPLGGGNGAGSIPVKVPYDYIRVNNGKADFYAKNTDGTYSSVISFDGNYTDNRLTEGNDKDIPVDYYTEKNYKKMIIKGEIKQKGIAGPEDNANKFIYTVTKKGDQKSVEFKMYNHYYPTDENKAKSIKIDSLSDFEEYLLDNGYYLKCEKKDSHTNEVPTGYRKKTGSHKEYDLWHPFGQTVIDYDYSDTPRDGYEPYDIKKVKYTDYYFRVFDATKTGTDKSSGQAVKDGNNNLYYCFSFPQDKESNIVKCNRIIGEFEGANLIDYKDYYINNMLFDLSDTNISLKQATAQDCPDQSQFTENLKNGNNKFSGKWHFIPWVFERSIDNNNISLDSRNRIYLSTVNNSLFCNGYDNYNDYTPNAAYKSIYYALEKDNKIDLINTDGNRMFSFNAAGKTDPLASADCIFKNVEITKKYKGDTWNLYYQKGSMPLMMFDKIEKSGKIISVYGKENDVSKPFIRFIYKGKDVEPDDIPENPPTGGYIHFSCDEFDGDYTVKIVPQDKIDVGESPTAEDIADAVNEAVKDDSIEGIYTFTSKANDFEIIGAVPNSELSCGVIGQPYAGDVESNTYYITCGLTGVSRKLLIRVTFTDLAKVKKRDGNFIEPRMDIWSIEANKITNNDLDTLKELSEGSWVKLEYAYRKG